MGNIDCYLHVVPETIVKKVVGKRIYDAYKKAYNAVTRDPSECTDDDIKEAIDNGMLEHDDDASDEWNAFVKAYDSITDTFKEKTGMDLCAEYTDDDGDCYDDLKDHRWYWYIPDDQVIIQKLTPAARDFQKKYGTKKTSAIKLNQRFSRYG
jgi:hypothetical protein